MPAPLPKWKIPYAMIGYLSRRQLTNQPTTLQRLSSRIGLSSYYLLSVLEESGVKYSLIEYDREEYGLESVEILLAIIPDDLAMDSGVSKEAVFNSYIAISGTDHVPEPTNPAKVDVVHGIRINTRHFEVIKDSLITRKELIKAGVERGCSVRRLRDAVGLEREVQVHPSWVPIVYKDAYYYRKEALDHFDDYQRLYELHKRKKKNDNEVTEKVKNFFTDYEI